MDKITQGYKDAMAIYKEHGYTALKKQYNYYIQARVKPNVEWFAGFNQACKDLQDGKVSHL